MIDEVTTVFVMKLYYIKQAETHNPVTVELFLPMIKYIFLFVIEPTRCTNFTNLFCQETVRFGQFVCPSSGVYSLYTQKWYMSYRFVDSFRAVYKPVWHIPLLNVQWLNSWWWTDELSETCRVSWQNKFVKLVHLVGSITKKFVMMHGQMNEKKTSLFQYFIIMCYGLLTAFLSSSNNRRPRKCFSITLLIPMEMLMLSVCTFT